MKFRVGQRVRLLHESGEGVVTKLIDKKHVEVDLGDDFPIDMHVDEIIAIDRKEQSYLTPEEESKSSSQSQLSFGPTVSEVSLAILGIENDTYEFFLMNPEPVDMLYSCYSQYPKWYEGSAWGSLPSEEYRHLFSLTGKQMTRLKGFRFQLLSFMPGKGHPHPPILVDFSWNRNRVLSPPRRVKALNAEGWVYSLREDLQKQSIEKIKDSEFIRIKQHDTDNYSIAFKPEIDIHIEELVDNPLAYSPSEMIKLQIDHVEKALADALLNNYPGMVIIHGVGSGTLKQAVKLILEKSPHVKSFRPADPARYGNGATEVFFK